MSNFFVTAETAGEGIGFSLFDYNHLAYLLMFCVILSLICFMYHRLPEDRTSAWRKCLAVGILANELFLKQIPLLILGLWAPKYLPLHLCSINVFLIAWHAWKGGSHLGDYLYTVCIPGALAALLFPGWTKLPPYSLMSIHSFTIHIMLVIYPVMLLIRGDIQPHWQRIPRCLFVLGALAMVALAANLLLDTNFFFLSFAEEGNPLYWFEVHWGSHLLGFPVLIAAVLAVMHAPLPLYSCIRKKRSRKAL